MDVESVKEFAGVEWQGSGKQRRYAFHETVENIYIRYSIQKQISRQDIPLTLNLTFLPSSFPFPLHPQPIVSHDSEIP